MAPEIRSIFPCLPISRLFVAGPKVFGSDRPSLPEAEARGAASRRSVESAGSSTPHRAPQCSFFARLGTLAIQLNTVANCDRIVTHQ